jgi:hypothetical protein
MVQPLHFAEEETEAQRQGGGEQATCHGHLSSSRVSWPQAWFLPVSMLSRLPMVCALVAGAVNKRLSLKNR